MTPSEAGVDASTDTSSRILDAAAELIQGLGVRRFRIEDVADAAGVSRQTVVNYFPRKDDLVRAVTRELLTARVQLLADRLEQFDDFGAGLEAAMCDELELMAALPALRPPLLQEFLDYLTGRGRELVDEQFELTGRALSELAGVDQETAALAGEVQARLILSYLLVPPDEDLDRAAAVIARAVASVLGH